MFFVSTAATVVPLRSCRFRFLPLLDSRWLLKPLFLLTFPEPVTRNLFAAALFVFIFGTLPPGRLLKTAHMLHCAPTDSLDVRKEYACARPFSRALPLNRFEQPANE
jgi:hypothetical protein